MGTDNSYYKATLKKIRKEGREKLNKLEQGYSILQNKDSDFGKAYRAIIDLQKETVNIWDSAPNEI